MWSRRPYIHHHVMVNEVWPRSLKSSESSPSRRFLSHSEYIIFDPLVAYMHMIHTYLTIHINIIQAGTISEEDNENYDAAILVCRIFAALKVALGDNDGMMLYGCITALLFAGLVFTNRRYPDGNGASTWVNGRISMDKQDSARY